MTHKTKKMLKALRSFNRPATSAELRRRAGLTRRTARTALHELERLDLATTCEIRTPTCNRIGFELA